MSVSPKKRGRVKGGATKFESWQTSKRDDNKQVLKLTEYLAQQLSSLPLSTAIEGDSHLMGLLTQASLDFNPKISTDREYYAWIRLMHQMAGARSDVFYIIFRNLLRLLRSFIDPNEYKDYGYSREVEVAQGVKCKSMADIKQKCIRAIQAQQLEKPFDPNGQEFKFLMAVLSNHPRSQEKLLGFKELKVKMTTKNAQIFRVLCLVYDPTKRLDDRTEDDISFSKCLPYIYDPNSDRIRDLLCDAIYRQFRSHFVARGATLLEYIKNYAPAPEFQQINGVIINAKLSESYILNYIKAIISLMSRSAIQAADFGVGQVNINSLETYKLYRALQSFLITYLHNMETERVDNDVLEASDEEAFNFWLREQAEELKKILQTQRNRYTTAQLEQAAKLVRNRALMYEKYTQVKTEEELGPIRMKLDNSFCLLYRFLRNELTTKAQLTITRSAFDKHFSNNTVLSEESQALISNASAASPLPSPNLCNQSPRSAVASSPSTVAMDVVSGGALMSDEGSVIDHQSIMSSRTSGFQPKVRVIQILFSHLLDDFELNCVAAIHCPILPVLYFGLIGLHHSEFYPMFQQRLKKTLCANGVTPELRELSLGLLIGHTCRDARLTVKEVIDILNILTNVLQKFDGQSRSQTSTELALVYSGCLEIMISRPVTFWVESVEDLLWVLCVLSFAEQKCDYMMTSLTRRIVSHLAARRLSELINPGKFSNLSVWIDRVRDHGIIITDPQFVTKSSVWQHENEWPERPFDRLDLHNFSSYVHCKGDYNEGWTKWPAIEHPTPVEFSETTLQSIWDRVVEGKTFTITATQKFVDKRISSSASNPSASDDDYEVKNVEVETQDRGNIIFVDLNTVEAAKISVTDDNTLSIKPSSIAGADHETTVDYPAATSDTVSREIQPISSATRNGKSDPKLISSKTLGHISDSTSSSESLRSVSSVQLMLKDEESEITDSDKETRSKSNWENDLPTKQTENVDGEINEQVKPVVTDLTSAVCLNLVNVQNTQSRNLILQRVMPNSPNVVSAVTEDEERGVLTTDNAVTGKDVLLCTNNADNSPVTPATRYTSYKGESDCASENDDSSINEMSNVWNGEAYNMNNSESITSSSQANERCKLPFPQMAYHCDKNKSSSFQVREAEVIPVNTEQEYIAAADTKIDTVNPAHNNQKEVLPGVTKFRDVLDESTLQTSDNNEIPLAGKTDKTRHESNTNNVVTDVICDPELNTVFCPRCSKAVGEGDESPNKLRRLDEESTKPLFSLLNKMVDHLISMNTLLLETITKSNELQMPTSSDVTQSDAKLKGKMKKNVGKKEMSENFRNLKSKSGSVNDRQYASAPWVKKWPRTVDRDIINEQ